MMEAKCTRFNPLDHPDTTATPPDALLGVVVNNHSVTPKNWVQPREETLGERRYKPFLCPLESHMENWMR